MGSPLAPKGGTAPPILAHVLWPNGCMDQGGTGVGLGPGHIVLQRTQLPLKGGTPPHPPFSARVCCGQTAGWIKIPLDREVDVGPGRPMSVVDEDTMHLYGDRPRPRRHCVKWKFSSPRKGHSTLRFRPMSIVAKWLDGSRRHLIRR